MPLTYGYGVVIGSLEHYERDPINDYGQYYHENVYVNTPQGVYHCAVDVDSKMDNDGIEWRVVPLNPADMKGVFEMPDGWHVLTSNDSSGALDNIRTDAFHRSGCNIVFVVFSPIFELLRRWFNLFINPPWSVGTSKEALDVLEPYLNDAKRLFVFGEPFHFGGLGVHDVHQNQGDPSGSIWWSENGIWQDGGIIIQKNDDSIFAYLTKFKTQSYTTNNSGHPSP